MHASRQFIARRRLVTFSLAAFPFLMLAAPVSAAPEFSIVPLGLDDPEHTRIDGFKFHTAHELNANGRVIGSSNRYGPSVDLGQSAWLYNGLNTIRIGLTDAEHTRNDDYRDSAAWYLNESGHVSGRSVRYNGGSIEMGQSVWLYDGASTINVGLTGAEHTRNDGYKNSFADAPFYQPREHVLNDAGQLLGYSYRFNGGSTDLGLSTWLYDGTTTVDVGLTGVEHTRYDGYKYSGDAQLNKAGHVIGSSKRFNDGSVDLGWSAWLYNGGATIDIGLSGPEFTRNDGYKSSGSAQLNNAGHVAGASQRFNGANDLGIGVWIYNGATTIDVGLTGPEHTRDDGYKFSEFINLYGYPNVRLNDAGQSVGSSKRYNGGNTELGRSAWFFNGSSTIDIGLTSLEHTSDNGFKFSAPWEINEAGQVSGHSERYNGSTHVGTSAWLYDGADTVEIGLTGSEFTSNEGFKSSEVRQLSETGQVIGSSDRWAGSTYLGQSAWLFDGMNTIEIGPTGSEHTTVAGGRLSVARALNKAGHVTGIADRYYPGGSADLGASAWLYTGATTNIIGLTGIEHTRSDGRKYSEPAQLNETGQVIGSSARWDGGSTYLGSDAWFYDPLLDQTFALRLSTRKSDNYARSSAEYLGDDSLVLGTYTLFDAMDNDIGQRAFYFTVADGMHDLGSLIDNGLQANGWDYLANMIRANQVGQIVGHGKLAVQSGGQTAYLLTRVHEPTSALLAGFALMSPVVARLRRLISPAM